MLPILQIYKQAGCLYKYTDRRDAYLTNIFCQRYSLGVGLCDAITAACIFVPEGDFALA
jgi:hypothetical protein